MVAWKHHYIWRRAAVFDIKTSRSSPLCLTMSNGLNMIGIRREYADIYVEQWHYLKVSIAVIDSAYIFVDHKNRFKMGYVKPIMCMSIS